MKLALGRALYDPGDPMGKLFFNILATFAEFEADLIRMRTREGMAIDRARRKLRGKQPKRSDRQQRELCRMHATGEYSISDLAELFSVSRPTVYRTLNRRHSPYRTILPPTGIDPNEAEWDSARVRYSAKPGPTSLAKARGCSSFASNCAAESAE